jgi:hypothetical protein
MVAILGAAFIAFALFAGYWLGTAHTNALWVERSTIGGGLRKECNGALYYVAACDDPVATCYLREWIEAEQDNRERAEHIQRMRGLG